MTITERKPRKTLFNPELKRRGIYVLPNLFTTAALFAGFFAIVQAMQGDFERAAMAIFICLGIVAYIILTLLVNRQTPANPDTIAQTVQDAVKAKLDSLEITVTYKQ